VRKQRKRLLHNFIDFILVFLTSALKNNVNNYNFSSILFIGQKSSDIWKEYNHKAHLRTQAIPQLQNKSKTLLIVFLIDFY